MLLLTVYCSECGSNSVTIDYTHAGPRVLPVASQCRQVSTNINIMASYDNTVFEIYNNGTPLFLLTEKCAATFV